MVKAYESKRLEPRVYVIELMTVADRRQLAADSVLARTESDFVPTAVELLAPHPALARTSLETFVATPRDGIWSREIALKCQVRDIARLALDGEFAQFHPVVGEEIFDAATGLFLLTPRHMEPMTTDLAWRPFAPATASDF